MIIQSLLDTDLYKFTMMQCAWHHYPTATVEYQFKCRTPGVDFSPCIADIEEAIDALCELNFKPDELNYLSSLSFIKPDFVTFLKDFRLKREQVSVGPEKITITGSWVETILFEVPILAIVNEVYYRHKIPNPDLGEGKKRLEQKIALVKSHPDNQQFLFSDFGTRRRFSYEWQVSVLKTLQQELKSHLSGTSNVYLAKAMNLRPIGTMAHEFLQAFQALAPELKDSQKLALQVWLKEYGPELGIALTDVVSTDAFLRDFDKNLAEVYLGVRHDSGDPIAWGHQIIAHYRKLNIDPKAKILVFSDALTFQSALAIYDAFKDVTNPIFGIGTHLMNDLGYSPLDIVIKMVICNGKPVAKRSDNLKKSIYSDAVYFKQLCKVFHVDYSSH